MKRKFITICAIALAGFALTLTFLGCKKDKQKEAPAVEESSEEDISSEDENTETD